MNDGKKQKKKGGLFDGVQIKTERKFMKNYISKNKKSRITSKFFVSLKYKNKL
ncbi:MAG: hypothetical protein LBQ24_04860 [Candidatus Peribacteria bacterium]|jgi:hypothetical protein|nr:hypothetical protein [Candidatus Peribacteria bacterium]